MLMNSKLIGKGRAMSVQTWTQRPQAAYTSWEEKTKTCKTFHHKIHEMEFQNELALWRKKQKATKKNAKMPQNQPKFPNRFFPKRPKPMALEVLEFPMPKVSDQELGTEKTTFQKQKKHRVFINQYILIIRIHTGYHMYIKIWKNMSINIWRSHHFEGLLIQLRWPRRTAAKFRCPSLHSGTVAATITE